MVTHKTLALGMVYLQQIQNLEVQMSDPVEGFEALLLFDDLKLSDLHLSEEKYANLKRAYRRNKAEVLLWHLRNHDTMLNLVPIIRQLLEFERLKPGHIGSSEEELQQNEHDFWRKFE